MEGLREGIVRGFAMDMYNIAIFKTDNQKGPTTQGALLNVTRQPGWDRSLGENGYMCMHG